MVGANLSSSQFGFLPYWSTVQQMLTMLAAIYDALDNKFSVECVYLDFCKAFDSVSHAKLLKLWNIGIVGSLWDRFRVYLTTRYQCIDDNSSTLDFLYVLSGVVFWVHFYF